jgi:flagellar hook-associated protein 2
VTFSGLSSGINTDSIIQQLLQVDSKPMVLLQQKQQTLQTEQTAIAQVNALVTTLQGAAAALQQSSAFTQAKATVGDATVATAAALNGAQSGTHTLQVTQLAKATTVGSIAKSSQTDALGAAGQFVVNGKAITVTTDDSLQSLATKLNSSGAGVNASIVQPTPGSYRLVIANAYTGDQQIGLSEVGSGSILTSALGLLSGGAASPAHPIAGGYASAGFADSGTSIATLMGMTSPSAGTVQINGVDVSIDLGTDSLTKIANKIQVATGLSTSVAQVTDPNTGLTQQRLQIQGATSFTDSNNVLANLGIVQQSLGAGASLVVGQNSKFTLDGIAMERTSNTVSDALSNVTLYLQKDAGSPSTQITVSTDTSGVKTGITNLVTAYNNLVSKIGDLASFDPATNTSGPLFGDPTIQAMMDDLTSALTGQVPGIGSGLSALSQIGISLDTAGHLSIDGGALDDALANRFSEVRKLIQSSGSTTDNHVTYVGSTPKTAPSGANGYSVYVSQPATKATLTAGTEHTASDNPTYELLTFGGIAFGSSSRGISIPPNATLDDIVSLINSDTTVSQHVVASKSGNQLVLTSTLYGSAGTFTVKSNQDAANNNSGIGSTQLVVTGRDIEGTVNGEEMTGSGQMLLGTTGNKTTEGLQLRVTASTAGFYGTVAVSNGLAVLTDLQARLAIDTGNGSLTGLSNSLNDQITDIKNEIADYQTRLRAEETFLRQQFSAMETAVALLKQNAAGLSALVGMSATSSSGSSGSSGSSSGSSSSG